MFFIRNPFLDWIYDKIRYKRKYTYLDDVKWSLYYTFKSTNITYCLNLTSKSMCIIMIKNTKMQFKVVQNEVALQDTTVRLQDISSY